MRRGEHPAGRDDGASTQMLAAEVEADLPGELTRLGGVAPDDTSAVLRPGAARWGGVRGQSFHLISVSCCL